MNNRVCAAYQRVCPPTLACVMCLCCFLHRGRRARFLPSFDKSAVLFASFSPDIRSWGASIKYIRTKTAQFCRQTVPKMWTKGDGGLKSSTFCGSTRWKPHWPLSKQTGGELHTPSVRQSKTLFDSAFCHRVHLWCSLHLEMYHPVLIGQGNLWLVEMNLFLHPLERSTGWFAKHS